MSGNDKCTQLIAAVCESMLQRRDQKLTRVAARLASDIQPRWLHRLWWTADCCFAIDLVIDSGCAAADLQAAQAWQY